MAHCIKLTFENLMLKENMFKSTTLTRIINNLVKEKFIPSQNLSN